MFIGRKRHNVIYRAIATVMVCLFLANDISWAAPEIDIPSDKSTLAPEARFNPFFNKHKIDFRQRAGILGAAAELKKLIIDGNELDDVEIRRAINRLNRSVFSDGAISISEETGYRELAGRRYRYVVFNLGDKDPDGERLGLMLDTIIEGNDKANSILDARAAIKMLSGYLDSIGAARKPAVAQAQVDPYPAAPGPTPPEIAPNGYAPHPEGAAVPRDVLRDGDDHGVGAAGINEKFDQDESSTLRATLQQLYGSGREYTDEFVRAFMQDAVAMGLGPQEFAESLVAKKSTFDRLIAAGKERLNGLSVYQAAKVIGASQPGLRKYLMKHPEEFEAYGILKLKPGRPVVVSAQETSGVLPSFAEIRISPTAFPVRNKTEPIIAPKAAVPNGEPQRNAGQILNEIIAVIVATWNTNKAEDYPYHAWIDVNMLHGTIFTGLNIPITLEELRELMDGPEFWNGLEQKSLEGIWVDTGHSTLSVFPAAEAPTGERWVGPKQLREPRDLTHFVAAVEEAARIHIENRKNPAISEKTMLCEIITDSILPAEQQPMLNRLQSSMRDTDHNPKIIQFKDPGNEDEFMTQLAARKDELERYYKARGYDNVRFCVASPTIGLVARIQDELGMKALAFSRENGKRGVIQVEGIIWALGALYSDNVEVVRNAYKLLTGKEAPEDVTDMRQLARTITFVLTVREDVNQIGRINRIIEDNIKSAA